MTTSTGPRAKRATRQTLSAQRDAMAASERALASTRIAAAVDRTLAALPVGTIALYAAKGSEVDPTPIDTAARTRGFRVAYPRIVPGQRELAFHLATPTELVAATFGLREPAATAPVVDLAEVVMICIPGLAFDRGGGRLGWGHGYYDATLARLGLPRPLLLGLAFERQIVADLPREPHDVLLDRIITEAA